MVAQGMWPPAPPAGRDDRLDTDILNAKATGRNKAAMFGDAIQLDVRILDASEIDLSPENTEPSREVEFVRQTQIQFAAVIERSHEFSQGDDWFTYLLENFQTQNHVESSRDGIAFQVDH